MENNKKQVVIKHAAQTVSDLSASIDAAIRATEERTQLLGYLASLESFIQNNRHDRDEVREAEEQRSKYEARIDVLTDIINKGKAAKSKYLDSLRFEQAEILDRMEFYSKKLDNCVVSMGDDRFPEAASDFEVYNDEYMRLHEKSKKIASNIAELQKIQ